jgi:hypothetical protein
MITQYLAELAAALSFDRRLARRVAREVEDHLRETVAEYAPGDRAEAERRAIANFGDPRVLAMQFASLSLARRTRRAGIAVVLAVIAVLMAMKVRVAWYAAAEWRIGEDARQLAGTVLAIDRYAFWGAIIVGLIALFYAGYIRVPAVLQAKYCRQNRRVIFLCAAAACSLVVSVVSDGVLTALQLSGELREAAIIPLVSMAAEIACAGAVILLIIDTLRGRMRTEALLRA